MQGETTRRRWESALAALALLLTAPAARAEWVDWIAEASSGFEFSDNLNRSAFRDDTVSDFSWTATGRAGRVFQASEKTRISLAAEFASAVQFRWTGYDRVRGSGEVAVLHKFGVGPDIPVLRVFGRAGYLAVDDGDRSGGVYETGFSLSKRVSPRLDGDLFFSYQNRDGGNGTTVVPTLPTNVWDQENFEVGFNTHYLMWPNILASVGYAYRDGEFDSSCTPGNVGKVFTREGSNVKAIAVNNIFGGCVYRLGGHTHQFSANLNYGLGDHFSVDLGYKFQQGQADVLIYRTNIVTLSVLYRY